MLMYVGALMVLATAALIGLAMVGAWAFGLALDRINRRLP